MQIAIIVSNPLLTQTLPYLISGIRQFTMHKVSLLNFEDMENIEEEKIHVAIIDCYGKTHAVINNFLISKHALYILINTEHSDAYFMCKNVFLYNSDIISLLYYLDSFEGQIDRSLLAFLHRNAQNKKNACTNLSAREHDVMDELVKGKSYKEISVDLNISINTVKVHAHKVYQKMHIHNRYELYKLRKDEKN